MKAATLTPWYPGTVAPVRAGVYERRFRRWPSRRGWVTVRWRWSYWCGKAWHLDGESLAEAIVLAEVPCAYQIGDSDFEWRGLAEPPKGQA